MNKSWVDLLIKFVDKKPIVVIQFNEDDSESILVSQRGPNRFSFTKLHKNFSTVTTPTTCIFSLSDGYKQECYFGIVKSKAAVSTLDSRVTVHHAQPIIPSTLKKLARLIENKRLSNLFKQKVTSSEKIAVLTPKVSIKLIQILSENKDNHNALESVAGNLSNFKHLPPIAYSQMDAIQIAIAAFGLSKTAEPKYIEVKRRSETTFNYLDGRIYEDNVIAHDAKAIPGFELIQSDVTGHAVFEKGDETLEVFTANRGPLEKMLGVDLIYINNTRKNVVMVQYKMLEEQRFKKEVHDEFEEKDWFYRPDKQFKKEISRMAFLKTNSKPTDYRLNNDPFYFKFFKRRHTEYMGGIIMPLEHLELVLKGSTGKGPKGGIRISFDSLEGRYLRETEFLYLIRSGYIGTHSEDTEHLKTIIREVSKGNKAIVLAWQRKIAEQ